MFIVFNNCKFNKIEFIKFDVAIGKFPKDNIDYKDDIRGIEFNWNNKINQSLEIKIKNSKFYGKFYINKQYDNNDKKTIIKELEIKETLFEENFKLNNCEIKKIFIKDKFIEEFEKKKFFDKDRISEIWKEYLMMLYYEKSKINIHKYFEELICDYYDEPSYKVAIYRHF